jgi:hypothetical protein
VGSQTPRCVQIDGSTTAVAKTVNFQSESHYSYTNDYVTTWSNAQYQANTSATSFTGLDSSVIRSSDLPYSLTITSNTNWITSRTGDVIAIPYSTH